MFDRYSRETKYIGYTRYTRHTRYLNTPGTCRYRWSGSCTCSEANYTDNWRSVY